MRQTKTRWRINYRFIAVFGAAFAVLAICLYFWHGYQLDHSAAILLERARQHEEQQEWVPLVKTLRRYLQMAPEDDVAWQMLANAEDKRSSSYGDLVDAARVHGRVLARPGMAGNVALRLRYARLLLDTGRYDDAATQADQAAKQGTPEQVQAAGVVRALALFELAASNPSRGDWGAIRTALESAIRSQPTAQDDLDLSMRLASMFRDSAVQLPALESGAPLSQDDRNELANKTVDDLVSRHPESAPVHLARYRYRTAYELDGAAADLESAIAHAGKDDIEVWLAAAESAIDSANGQPAGLRGAQGYFESGREAAPADRRPYIGLVRTLLLIEAAEPNGKSVAAAEELLNDALKKLNEKDFELQLWQARIFTATSQQSKFDATVLELDAIRAANQLTWSTSLRALAQVEVDRLRAENLLSRSQFAAAAELLERIAQNEQGVSVDAESRTQSWVASPFRTWMLLGRARESMKEADRAARAYEQALRTSPESGEARRAAARAWTAAGRSDLAAAHWDMNEEDVDADEAISRMSYVINTIRELPADERDWGDARGQLAKLREQAETRFRASLLTAQVESECRDAAAALAAVQTAEQTPPRSPAEWRALVSAYQALNAEAEAERCLAHFATMATPAELALFRSELLQQQKRFTAAENVLRDARATADTEQAAALDLGLARLLLSQTRYAEAKPVLEAATRDETASRREAVRLLAGLDFETQDWAGLERTERLLKEIDGPTGTEWRYFRANRLLRTARDAESMQQAADLAQELTRERPDWLAAIQLEAEVAERQGKIADAVAVYERGVGLSAGTDLEMRLGTRLVELAFAQAGPSGALTPSLENTIASSRNLSATAISRAVAEGQVDRALRLATLASQLRPRDPLAKFWLGQTQLLAGQAAEASQSLQQAIEGAADFALAWESLLNVLMTTGKAEQAAALVARLEMNANLPEPNRSLLLARAKFLTGSSAAADRLYRELIERHPDDEAVAREAISFFSDRDVDLAEKLARNALARAPNSDEARRMLAATLGARGGDAAFAEAAKLLGAVDSTPPAEETDLRQYAQLLARRSEQASRREAAAILAGLAARKSVVPSQERLTLVGLYESEGQHREALQELLALTQRTQVVVPDHLAALAEYAFKHRDAASAEQFAAAEKALTELERREPESWRTLTLKLRHARAIDPAADIEQPLTAFTDQAVTAASTPRDQAALLVRSADFCNELQEPALAEPFLRRAASASPEGMRALVMFLANKADVAATREAVDICLTFLAANNSPSVASTLCMALTVGGPGDADVARAEPVLRDALAKHPRDAGLLFAWGSYQLVRGADEQASEALQKSLELAPGNALAINNLAYLRVSQGRAKDALPLAERAIAMGGPAPNFLDTLGLALLDAEQRPQALKLFSEMASTSKDPAVYLHLAMAQEANGLRAEAQASLAGAKTLLLNVATLPAFDRRRLSELETALSN